MGANLAMNPAAPPTDRRHPDAQGPTDAASTLARTNQSDRGNFPGSGPVFPRENIRGNQADTRRSTLRQPGKVLAYLPSPTDPHATFPVAATRAQRLRIGQLDLAHCDACSADTWNVWLESF
jgi:hypothetical protein